LNIKDTDNKDTANSLHSIGCDFLSFNCNYEFQLTAVLTMVCI